MKDEYGKNSFRGTPATGAVSMGQIYRRTHKQDCDVSKVGGECFAGSCKCQTI